MRAYLHFAQVAGWYSVPRASNAQMIRACLAASATAATLLPDRALSASTQTLLRSVFLLVNCSTERAP